jgi:hypothetical protein
MEKTTGKTAIADLVAGTRKVISRIRSNVVELSTRGEKRLELMSLKNQRARLFRELGMKVFVLIRHGKCSLPDVQQQYEGLVSLEETIRRLEGGRREEAAAPPPEKTVRSRRSTSGTAKKVGVRRTRAPKPPPETKSDE